MSFLTNRFREFYLIYNFGAVGHEDELITFFKIKMSEFMARPNIVR